MSKLAKYNNIAYIALRILIGADIIYRYRINIVELLVFLSLYLFILVNDLLRMHIFYKSYIKYYTSIFASIAISGFLVIIVNGYFDIYMFIVLYELILYTEGTVSKIFIGLEIIFFIILVIVRSSSMEEITSIEYLKNNLLDILMSLLGISFYTICLFAYKALSKEKRKVEKLNKELQESNNKLKDQAEKIEELTITKERNRIAGDIHDNIGHNLVALNMNLDVAANIIDKNEDKARELIKKAQSLTKESLDDLRKVVYALKEDVHEAISSSINNMIINIEMAEKIKIITNIDEKTDEIQDDYRNIIISSVKEAITNSIKHGRAEKISLDIHIDDEAAHIIIKDNGKGCNSFVKGNGLYGIEKRIVAQGGIVEFNSKENSGFEIRIALPYKKM